MDVQSSEEEREDLTPREAARDSVFVGATIWCGGNADEHTARIRNISPGGMMVDYPGGCPIGGAVRAEIKGLGQVTGTIVWSTAKHVGIRFDCEVDPAAARIKPPKAIVPAVQLPPVKGRRPGLAIR